MVRILKVEKLTERKKILLMQSELNRHTLRLQVATMQHSIAQMKKRFTIAGISSVALSGVASIVTMMLTRRKEPGKEGGGIVSKIFSGINLFNQAKGIWNRFRQPQGGSGETGE